MKVFKLINDTLVQLPDEYWSRKDEIFANGIFVLRSHKAEEHNSFSIRVSLRNNYKEEVVLIQRVKSHMFLKKSTHLSADEVTLFVSKSEFCWKALFKIQQQ